MSRRDVTWTIKDAVSLSVLAGKTPRVITLLSDFQTPLIEPVVARKVGILKTGLYVLGIRDARG